MKFGANSAYPYVGERKRREPTPVEPVETAVEETPVVVVEEPVVEETPVVVVEEPVVEETPVVEVPVEAAPAIEVTEEPTFAIDTEKPTWRKKSKKEVPVEIPNALKELDN